MACTCWKRLLSAEESRQKPRSRFKHALLSKNPSTLPPRCLGKSTAGGWPHAIYTDAWMRHTPLINLYPRPSPAVKHCRSKPPLHADFYELEKVPFSFENSETDRKLLSVTAFEITVCVREQSVGRCEGCVIGARFAAGFLETFLVRCVPCPSTWGVDEAKRLIQADCFGAVRWLCRACSLKIQGQ